MDHFELILILWSQRLTAIQQKQSLPSYVIMYLQHLLHSFSFASLKLYQTEPKMLGLSKTESVRCLRWQPTTPKSRGNRRRPHKNYKQPWNSFNYNWTEDLIFVPEYFFFPQFNNVGHFLHSKLTAHNFMCKKRTLSVFYLLLVQPLAFLNIFVIFGTLQDFQISWICFTM